MANVCEGRTWKGVFDKLFNLVIIMTRGRSEETVIVEGGGEKNFFIARSLI